MTSVRELRIGLLCQGGRLPHWQVQCIQHLLEQPGVTLAAIARSGEPRMDRRLRTFFEVRLGVLLQPTASALTDVSEMFEEITELRFEPSKGMAEKMRTSGANVILSFLPNELTDQVKGDLPIWRFDFQGHGLDTYGAPTFRAWMLQRAPVAVDLVSSSGERVRTTISDRSWTGKLDMDRVMLGAAWLPVAMSRAFGSGGAHGLEKASRAKAAALPMLVTQWMKMEFQTTFRGKKRAGLAGEWNIGIYPHPISSLLEDSGNTNVRWLSSPSPGSHRSEPFGFRGADGQLNVLYRKSEGVSKPDVIARIRPKGDGILKRSRTMLSTLAPLGYPFALQHEGQVLVIVSYPHQQRTELFKVSDNNDALDHICTLLDRAIINPTYVEHDGRSWLFGTDPDAPDGILRIFHAPTLQGPYTSHALAPVDLSGSGSRPAGSFFRYEGALYRPSVDNSDPDVSSVIFNRIIELTPDTFKEEPVRVFSGFPASFYNKGIRTVCDMGSITLVDGLRPAPEAQELEAEGSSSQRKQKDYTEE